MLIQQSGAFEDRSVRAPTVDLSPSMELPIADTRATKMLGFDANGDVAVSGSTMTDIDASVAAAFAGGVLATSYQFTGDGATVDFTVTGGVTAIPNAQALIITIDGVTQHTDTYTTAAAVVTFSTAPPLNADIQIRYNAYLGTATDASAITYNQGGTGASSRTVENKLQESVSVKDFGAVGDGVTNDTAAIQAALNASNNVFIPEGTYSIKSPLIVNDNQVVTGTGTIAATADFVSPYIYTSYSSELIYAQTCILSSGKENITISGLTLDISLAAVTASHIRKEIIFYHYEVGVYKEQFKVSGVTFKSGGVAAYCNVRDVFVSECVFKDVASAAVSFETTYPNGGATPHQRPIGFYFENNIIDTSSNDESVSVMWISGCSRVRIINNKIATRGSALHLYVNDLSLGIEDVVVEGNSFWQNTTTTVDVSLINVMGRSYPYPATLCVLKGIVISNNSFNTATDYSAQTASKPSAISARFAGDTLIDSNNINNFYYGIGLSDAYSTTTAYVSNMNILRNKITDCGEEAITIENSIRSLYIALNTFTDWGKQATVFADKSCLDLRKIANTRVDNNVFKETATSATRIRLINAGRSVNCSVLGNKNLTSLSYLSVSTRDYASFNDEGVVDRRSLNSTFNVARGSYGSYAVGDKVNFSHSPFLSGGKYYVAQVCITKGTNAAAFTETATGTAGATYFALSSYSGEVRAGQYLTIDANNYKVTDIDYRLNKVYTDVVLATTFSAVAITAQVSAFKYTEFYV